MKVETTRPWDLVGVAALALLTGALVAFDFAQPLRVVLGLPFVLFLPGYSIVAALFPERHNVSEPGESSEGETDGATERVAGGVDGLDRVALSLGLSVAVVPLIGLGLNFTPWGLRLVPMMSTLTILILGGSGTAVLRRTALPKDERFQLTARLESPEWRSIWTDEKMVMVGVAISIILAISSLAYVLTTPQEGDRFTEFYILGPEGKASEYPTNLSGNQTDELIVVVTNQEDQAANYTVELIDQPGRFRNESGTRTFVPQGNQTLDRFQLRLEHNETHREEVAFALTGKGHHRLLLHLEADHRETSPYQRLHLFVNVTAGSDR